MQESHQFIPFLIILTGHHFSDPHLVSTIVSEVDLNGLIYYIKPSGAYHKNYFGDNLMHREKSVDDSLGWNG